MLSEINIQIINQLSDNYSYVIYSVKTKKALVVDPSESDSIINFIKHNNLILQGLLITHHHSDHTSGINGLLTFKNTKVYSPNSSIVGTTDLIKDGDKIDCIFIDFQIIATPGHTLDHIVYYCKKNNLLFCGDVLFSLGCGRIFAGDYDQLFSSLKSLDSV